MNKKILTLDNLRKIRIKYKSKKIVLAHGTFDFFHYGHLKHLQKSKNKGDILVVSLTADDFMRKGPGRPIYNESQRAEIISSIDFVDYVSIVHSLSGIEVIKALKPNYYSKGIEYKNKINDFTNKISIEEKTVKICGGKVFYTNENVLSASKLINKFRNSEKKPKNIFLSELKKSCDLNFFLNNFNRVKNKKILIIGDTILDEYIFTKALAKSPKEELISVKEDERKLYLGGILATAKHISNFVKMPTLLTVVGSDTNTNHLIKKSFKNQCKLVLFKDNNRKNIQKTRYLDGQMRKLFQSNDVPFEDINKNIEKKIIFYLNKSLKYYDLVVINDFGHGLLTSKIRKLIEKKSNKLAINVQSNSANLGYNFFNKYKKCDYLTMDEPEARMATGERFAKIDHVVKGIKKIINAKIIAVTHGPKGTRIFDKDKNFYIPALSTQAVDTLGAGDAFFAISSIYSLADKNARNLAFIGNLSGALKIKYLGHEKTIKQNEFFIYLKSLLL